MIDNFKRMTGKLLTEGVAAEPAQIPEGFVELYIQHGNTRV